jgi:2-C-methyl-D-erythritol 2,4-cyclodiphosphate synthase
MAEEFPSIRIGHGFDVHAFAPGRRLVLGTREITYELGLSGHSDADVLLHAVIDAVLGALAWGDIGSWFPDTDQRWKDISSKELFSRVWQRARAEGWSLINCDCVVLAEEPKLRPYVEDIRQALAELFSVPAQRIGLKATTTERMGFIGRHEGMAASAVVLLEQRP